MSIFGYSWSGFEFLVSIIGNPVLVVGYVLATWLFNYCVPSAQCNVGTLFIEFLNYVRIINCHLSFPSFKVLIFILKWFHLSK